jgi:hypothetical protein
MLRSVPPWSAQRLGAMVGAALALAWVVWARTRATPCPGAVSIEFHPPLADRGQYDFSLAWDDIPACRFTVTLPMPAADKGAPESSCKAARELGTQVQDGRERITSLTFAAAPKRFHLRVKRNGELTYDTFIEPRYAPYETTRRENKHFCGERARVLPSCLRGSTECQPFQARCAAPQDCPAHRACCLTPEWGQDFGPESASECAVSERCLEHFGHLGCHIDADCPAGMRCIGDSLAADFEPRVRVCESP